jgi:hypothetical protein
MRCTCLCKSMSQVFQKSKGSQGSLQVDLSRPLQSCERHLPMAAPASLCIIQLCRVSKIPKTARNSTESCQPNDVVFALCPTAACAAGWGLHELATLFQPIKRRMEDQNNTLTYSDMHVNYFPSWSISVQEHAWISTMWRPVFLHGASVSSSLFERSRYLSLRRFKKR